MSPGSEPAWGRLLIAGGTDFATLGRKDKGGKSFANDDRPELPSAHIMRPVANIKFKRVFASHSGCHAVVIDIKNRAYLIGRNEHHQLSHPLPTTFTSPHVSPDGIVSPTPSAPYPFPLVGLPDANAPKALKSQGIVSAGLGRNHTVLVTDGGEAWSAGLNSLGQCGHAGQEHISSFTRVGGALLGEKVVAAGCGITFSLFLCESGKVFAVGSGEKGQLGNGKTGEHIAASKVFFSEQSDPLLVRGAIEGKKIIQIACGQQHSIALDDEGFCYAWGFGGLGRLGMGAQFDVMIPTVIPNFAGPNVLTRATKIAAGPGNSMFIDAQGMVSLCGKWKTSGDGSAGQPWMAPKLVQEIQGYKWRNITAGGVTLFASTYDPKEGDFMVGWGQGAGYGELALGAGTVKSATKPVRIDGFDGITILDIAGGQNTTFFIARPPPTSTTDISPLDSPAPEIVETPVVAPPTSGIDLSGFGFSFGPPAVVKPVEKLVLQPVVERVSRTLTEAWEELLRYPTVLDAVDQCQVCGLEDGPEESLECEMCENAFHGACLTPPIVGVPEGEWFCPKCSAEGEVVEEEEEEEASAGKKRKAGSAAVEKKAAPNSKKKKA